MHFLEDGLSSEPTLLSAEFEQFSPEDMPKNFLAIMFLVFPAQT